MSGFFKRRMVQATAVEDDVVIDLTDRLAPYSGSMVRPIKRKKTRLPAHPVTQEPELWTPLELDFLHKSPSSPQ